MLNTSVNPNFSYPYTCYEDPRLKDAFKIINSLSLGEITYNCFESELRTLGFTLHDPVSFNSLLPALKKLPHQTFCLIMSALDRAGNTPLHCVENLSATLEAFKDRPFKDLFRLFSLRTYEGKTLLHFPNLFEICFNVLAGYSLSEVIALLSIPDDNGVTPLEADEVFQSVGKKLFMTKCFDFVDQRYRFDQLFEILKIQNKRGKRLLHSPAILRHALNHLGDLEAAEILQILRLKNAQGRTVLHDTTTFIIALPLLEKLSSYEIWELFTTGDNQGHYPLQNKTSLLMARAFLNKKFETTKLIELLITTKHEKNDPLFKTFIFLKGKRNHEALFTDLLSYLINLGTAPIQNERLFKTFEPILRTLSAKELFEFFSLKNKEGQTQLFESNRLPLIANYLSALDQPSQLALFSIRDSSGRTLLHYPERFTSYWSFIQNFPFETQFFLLSIRNKEGFTALHNRYVMLEFLSVENLEPEKLQKIMLIQNRFGMSVLFYGMLNQSINELFLKKVYQIDFDPTTIRPGFIPAVLQQAIEEWLDSNPKVEKGKSPLFWPLLLGLDYLVVERLAKLPPSEQKLLYEQFPDRAGELQTLLTLRNFRVCPGHMSAGVDLTEKPPPPIDLELLKFTGLENRVYVDFYSFIHDMIAGSRKEIDEITKFRLHDMYKKISQNEQHLYFAENERVRREQYKEFCNYLAHVVYAYKIGQAGGNDSFKKIVLELVGEAQRECRPRWMNEIKKLYASRPGEKEIILPPHTLVDKVLQRLRIERIRILELKIHNVYDGEFERENFHEANFRLNLFREELDTRLAPIDDPSAEYDCYPFNKRQLRSSFYFFYTKGFIVQSIQNHLNDSPNNVTQAKSERIDSLFDNINLPKDEVEKWFKDQCPPEWGKKTYRRVVEKALDLDSPSEAEALLSKYGIFVQLETTVPEALSGLEREIQRGKLKIRSFQSILNEIKDIKNSTELSDFLARHTEFPSDTPLEKLENEASALKEKHENKAKALENLKEEVSSLACEKEKKEKLAKANRIQPADNLDELLTDDVIEEARLNEFVKRIFRDEKGLYTPQAVIFMLKKMGILEKAAAQEIFS